MGVLSPCQPDLLIGASLGSPLVLGLHQGENFLASDPGALAGVADEVVFLKDEQMCVLDADSWHMLDGGRGRVTVHVEANEFATDVAVKGDFEHYMLKEIYEQPLALKNALHDRIERRGQ